ncbi:hypothetical protein [uncultured Microbulbifer sp.]|uniref:hypothetical protein n=1 Tax=uncultured Microbulbifer sp. TaxID=348147 RepID=UPI0026351914|nr:hypothetical protein [uncultured Microbulbifer sp.]
MALDISSLGDAVHDILGLSDYEKLQNTPGAICFEEKFEKCTVELIFSYHKMVSGYSFRNGITGRKSFSEVEGLLEKYYKKYDIKMGLGTIFRKSESVDFRDKIFDHQIMSVDTLNEVTPILKGWIYDDILPFLDHFKRVEDVYEKMESMPLNDRSGFVCNPMPIRSLIMKGLLKTDDFVKYGSRLEAFLDKQKDSVHYKNETKYFEEMYQELKDMQ